MIVVSEILSRVSRLLNDEDNVTWTVPELIDWINDGAAQIVTRRPPAGSVTDTLTLEEGVLHRLDSNDIALLDLTRNIKSDDKPGRPISRTSRYLLDSFEPDWYERTPEGTIVHFTVDDRDPTIFYTYPPVEEGTKAEALVSRAPVKVSESTDELAMDRVYMGPLVSYIAHRALSKDDEGANAQAASLFYGQFAEALGSQNETSAVVSPNRSEA